MADKNVSVTSPDLTDVSDSPAAKVNTATRRKDMIARIAETAGVRPNAVKTVLDAVLSELGDALSRGEVLNLPPLGKVMVNRQKTLDDGEVLICKIRRKNRPKADDTTAD